MLQILCYAFSFIAFAIFIYSFFLTKNPALNKQAIYWFYSSIISLLIPNIKHFKYGDIEVAFREELQKVEETLDKKTRELKDLTLASVYQRLQNLQEAFFTKYPNDTYGAQKIIKEAFDVLNSVEPQFPENLYIKNFRAYMLKNNAMLMKDLNHPVEFDKSLSDSFEIFKAILDKDPEDAGAWNGLGSIYVLRGEPEKALLNIDKALEINPGYKAAAQDRKTAIRMINQKKKR